MSAEESPRERLSLLLERQSCAALQEPAPAGDALALILEAALRVPDHMHLRPLEFIIAEGPGLDHLGAIMQQAALAAGQSEALIARAPRMPHRAPMVVVVVARHRPSEAVPPLEQQLTAGCAVMAMQTAAQGLGFGGIWRSGWFMYDRGLHAALGLEEPDQIVGFLYLGTPKPDSRRPLPPVAPMDFVRRL